MVRQEETVKTQPPIVGAKIGATPTISIKIENILAISVTGNKSRTTALLTTIPTHPPKAKTTRIAISQLISGDKAQPMEAKRNIESPKIKGFFLPNLSVIGP